MDERTTDIATTSFVTHRNLLFTIAYEMLGSASDAEDILQETWMRWANVDIKNVRDHRAYLVRITTRQSLNLLRTLKRRREEYVGNWLPEPILTAPDVADDVELSESISMALMIVLDSLSPTERAVFVLHDIFGVGYDEIANTVDKSEDAVRQIASRARKRVEERRPRKTASRQEARAALETFQQAIQTGEIEGFLKVLAPDVVFISDGGGVKRAALKPIAGAERFAKTISNGMRKAGAEFTTVLTTINGGPALTVYLDGEMDGILAAHVENSLITGLYYVRNPEKLSRIDTVTYPTFG